MSTIEATWHCNRSTYEDEDEDVEDVEALDVRHGKNCAYGIHQVRYGVLRSGVR